MKNTAKRMMGASLSQILIFCLLLFFFAYTGLRLAPSYVQNYQIKDALREVLKQAVAKSSSKEEIRDLFSRQLQVNDIRRVDLKGLNVDRKKDKLTINFDYEDRVHVIANIDAVLVFKNRVESE